MATGATVIPRLYSTPEAAWMKQSGGHIEEDRQIRSQLMSWFESTKPFFFFFKNEKGILELTSAISTFWKLRLR